VIRRIAVVVPAADEERRIGRCLRAVAAARRHLAWHHGDIQTQVVVVLDGCRDATAAVCASFPWVDTVTIASRNAGAARRAGAEHALRGSSVRARELWLASTDADSVVPGNWLTGMMAAAAQGAELVLGTVLPGPELSPALRARWLSRHQLRDGHPHVHGANLGLRADAYLALGGWRALATGEDFDLARRAASAGSLHIRRTAAIPVTTSVRRDGRAPSGFSSYLRALGTEPDLAAQPGLAAEPDLGAA
jgi:glycosyltransferase involved in cell wall biosynthesis